MPPIDLPAPTSTLVALEPRAPKAAISPAAELAGTALLVQEAAFVQNVPVLFQANTGAGSIVIVRVCSALVPRGLVAVNHRDLSEEIDAVAKNIAMLRLDQAAVAKIPSLTPKQREAMVVAIWRTRGDVFKTHADLEEFRKSSDTAFVGDLRRATVALPALLGLAQTGKAESVEAKLEELDQSLRILAGGQ